jgi:hypothetical protein
MFTYNVHWGTLVQPLLQWKSHNYCVWLRCFRGLSYAACNTHTPYCHLWPAPLYIIFPPYLIKATNFENVYRKHKMCVLIFSTTFVWNISHSKEKWARYDKKCLLVFMQSTGYYSCQILINLNFWTVFRKNAQIYNLIKIRPMGAELFHADWRSDMTELTVAFRNFANAPKTSKDRKGGSRLFDMMQYVLDGNEWEIRCM